MLSSRALELPALPVGRSRCQSARTGVLARRAVTVRAAARDREDGSRSSSLPQQNLYMGSQLPSLPQAVLFGLMANVVVPLSAHAEDMGPSLKNLFFSLTAGLTVLVGLSAAVLAMAKMDPVRRRR